MSAIKNCPNCGAVVTSNKCEYCGTIFYDIGDIATLDEHLLGNIRNLKTYVSNFEVIPCYIDMPVRRDQKGQMVTVKPKVKHKITITLIEF